MKIYKTKNKGFALVAIVIMGAALLTTGYLLYDQLIFSNKMTAKQVYKNQLSLHNISVADTVQTILNTVVENDNGEQVKLFTINGNQFRVVEDNLTDYISSVYDGNKSGQLQFKFNVCNFINTDEYDSIIKSNEGTPLKEESCNNGTISSEAQASIRAGNADIIIDVTSTLPQEDPYKGFSLSSSFVFKLPPPATNCIDYVDIDNNRIVLTSNKQDDQGNLRLHEQVEDVNGNLIDYFGYVTFPGFNIEGYIPYKFLIDRYGGANLNSDECITNDRGDTICEAIFSMRTYYISSDKNRFTTYSYNSVYMSIPTGKANFWSDPREYQGCNNVYTLVGGGPGCNPAVVPNRVDHVSLANGGWTDKHTFKIRYIRSVNGTSICSIDRKTVSGLTPGLRQTGCFDENTLVEDNLGNKIKVKDLTMGQALKNPVTNETVRVVRTVAGPEEQDLVEILTEDARSILVTWDHPLKTDRGLISADKLEKSDRLFNEKGSIKIKNIKKVPSNNRTVYNFMVKSNKKVDSDKDHYVIANGIISGDLYLQNKLKYINSLVSK